jgi:hypothetical protein
MQPSHSAPTTLDDQQKEAHKMYDREIETRHVLQRYPKGGVAPSRYDLERYNYLERQKERAARSPSTSSAISHWTALARAAIPMTVLSRVVSFLIRRAP